MGEVAVIRYLRDHFRRRFIILNLFAEGGGAPVRACARDAPVMMTRVRQVWVSAMAGTRTPNAGIAGDPVDAVTQECRHRCVEDQSAIVLRARPQRACASVAISGFFRGFHEAKSRWSPSPLQGRTGNRCPTPVRQAWDIWFLPGYLHSGRSRAMSVHRRPTISPKIREPRNDHKRGIRPACSVSVQPGGRACASGSATSGTGAALALLRRAFWGLSFCVLPLRSWSRRYEPSVLALTMISC